MFPECRRVLPRVLLLPLRPEQSGHHTHFVCGGLPFERSRRRVPLRLRDNRGVSGPRPSVFEARENGAYSLSEVRDGESSRSRRSWPGAVVFSGRLTFRPGGSRAHLFGSFAAVGLSVR